LGWHYFCRQKGIKLNFMADITFHHQGARTEGFLPEVGTLAPDFLAVKNDLATVKLSDFQGKKVLLNIFPSIDTGVCAASVRKFHAEASKVPNVAILCISKDLPFALGRFCAAEGIDNLTMLSDFRGDFAAKYPISFVDTPLQGLLSRCVVVVNEKGEVVYTEQVAETTDEPNYEKALEALR